VALARPQREVMLLEANGRKAAFLERFVREIPNANVVRRRAEEHETEAYGIALARALAPPPVAVEWCLPLVRRGGAVVLYVGPTADIAAVSRAAHQVGGGAVEQLPGMFVIPKVSETPPGFPRRPGMARKRPLA
jgi:16S rRNA (guanine527-N7)-methyltransferase